MSLFRKRTKFIGIIGLAFALLLVAPLVGGDEVQAIECTGGNTVIANVVLFDTPMVFNRLGAQNPNWMMYALEHDVVPANGVDLTALVGDPPRRNVMLRPDKRPRPLTLRVNEGQCLQINFTNLLSPNDNPFNQMQDGPIMQNNNQVASRMAGVHVAGMQLVDDELDDASYVGTNASSLVAPLAGGVGGIPADGQIQYLLYAEHEGSFLLSSHGATFGGEATGGNVGVGAFGVVNVQPHLMARHYRSMITEEEMRLASMKSLDPANPNCGVPNLTLDGHPIIDYEAEYPSQDCNAAPGGTGIDLGAAVWIAEGKAGRPIINMNDGNVIWHSEVNAIIAGPNADGTFPTSTYPLEANNLRNPTVPNRLEAFREFSSIWHDENAAAQAFPGYFDPFQDVVTGEDQNPLAHTLHGVRDSFMINYASGGIGSEIIANRLGVGPMYDCLGCAYEEFFLTSFTVGDPGMRVDIPANFNLENCGPTNPPPGCFGNADGVPPVGIKAEEAFFPEDPANVHHSYVGDFAKFRNVHAGPKEQHVFHLHNHQWLFNANDDNANYLDAQGIGPGSSYTYEINFGGTGNRNKTAGDAIFHCHFYPHFAQGMWYLLRIHDVMETGTVLAVTPNTDGTATGFHTVPFALKSGKPAPGARALPDAEIIAGTPIPAVVPLPGKPMPPLPGPVTVVAKDVDGDGVADSSQANVDRDVAYGEDETPGTSDDVNPGYPFWIAGVDCRIDDSPITIDGTTRIADNCDHGIVGQRPPTPQLDMITRAEAQDLFDAANGDDFYKVIANQTSFVNAAGGFDGGLPRHSIDGCKAAAFDINFPAELRVPGCTVPAFNPNLLGVYESAETKLDFHKEVLHAKPVYYPEAGTDLEKVAMRFHGPQTVGASTKHHDTFFPDGLAATGTDGFRVNGAPPVPGAPYQEPCIDDEGDPLYQGSPGQFFGVVGLGVTGSSTRNATNPFVYKGANIQIDAEFNKVGYHYPQQRIIALWEDVMDTINKVKPPEPLVMRLNTFDCSQYYHSNLVPKEFEVDDYQVRTPTDIIGQHIHLPKWDLTTADGAANGWNYEDGTLAPGAVVERIHAINAFNGDLPEIIPNPDFEACRAERPRRRDCEEFIPNPAVLHPQPHPELGAGVGGEWLGSRVTTQRWFTDPVVDRNNVDRGLGIVFTHDHYGPSTHQQIGLYATLLVEPAGSEWRHNETGTLFGTRDDGGPTSWQAVIIPPDEDESYREFYFEFTDFQSAYEAGVYVGAGPDGRPNASHNVDGVNTTFPVTADTFRNAINPSYRQQAGPVFPDIGQHPAVCPDGFARPCPEAITADDTGMLVVNYRNEPVGLRVFDPNKEGPDSTLANPKFGSQADGIAGDLAFALKSQLLVDPVTGLPTDVPLIDPVTGETLNEVDRAIPEMSTIAGVTNYPVGGPNALNRDSRPGDPFTPIARSLVGDRISFKLQAGGHEHEHLAHIHGHKWVQGNSGFGPVRPTGGWSKQNAGISEQFNFTAPVILDPRANVGQGNINDLVYSVDASQDGWWSGMWGLMRVYDQNRGDLEPLPNSSVPLQVQNRDEFIEQCPDFVDNSTLLEGPDGIPDNPRVYDVTAVLANDVLGNALGVTITGGLADQADIMHVGGPLDPSGGTLVYNPRVGPASNGPLHDPTAMMYVMTDDLLPVGVVDTPENRRDPLVDVVLRAGAPVEPLVLRANSGECIVLTLRNRLPALQQVGLIEREINECTIQVIDGIDTEVCTPVPLNIPVMNSVAPDLAGYNTLLQVVIRDRGVPGPPATGVTTFNNNLIRPSSFVGIHPQLVTYDITKSDGTNMGRNPEIQTIAPGQSRVYHWYAGDVSFADAGRRGRVSLINLDPTPVEFGGANLSPADKIKQGQKGLIGALVIGPPGATIDETDETADRQDGVGTRNTRLSATVDSYRDLVVVVQKGNNHRLVNGAAVPNIASEGQGIPEDSHDAGQKGINYGTEPAWFRFGLAADAPLGNGAAGSFGAQPDAWKLYANEKGGGADPWTSVFTATAGDEVRMRVLQPYGVGRGTTFTLHGHIWARDPYLPENPGCLFDNTGLDCGLSSVSIGHNPKAWYLNGQESVTPYNQFDIVLPSAGGVNAVDNTDYLFRDQASFGNTDGIWGILRVNPPTE